MNRILFIFLICSYYLFNSIQASFDINTLVSIKSQSENVGAQISSFRTQVDGECSDDTPDGNLHLSTLVEINMPLQSQCKRMFLKNFAVDTKLADGFSSVSVIADDISEMYCNEFSCQQTFQVVFENPVCNDFLSKDHMLATTIKGELFSDFCGQSFKGIVRDIHKNIVVRISLQSFHGEQLRDLTHENRRMNAIIEREFLNDNPYVYQNDTGVYGYDVDPYVGNQGAPSSYDATSSVTTSNTTSNTTSTSNSTSTASNGTFVESWLDYDSRGGAGTFTRNSAMNTFFQIAGSFFLDFQWPYIKSMITGTPFTEYSIITASTFDDDDNRAVPEPFHQLRCCVIDANLTGANPTVANFTLYPHFGFAIIDDVDTCYDLPNSRCTLFRNETYPDNEDDGLPQDPLCFPECEGEWNKRCTPICALWPSALGKNVSQISNADIYKFSPGFWHVAGMEPTQGYTHWTWIAPLSIVSSLFFILTPTISHDIMYGPFDFWN